MQMSCKLRIALLALVASGAAGITSLAAQGITTAAVSGVVTDSRRPARRIGPDSGRESGDRREELCGHAHQRQLLRAGRRGGRTVRGQRSAHRLRAGQREPGFASHSARIFARASSCTRRPRSSRWSPCARRPDTLSNQISPSRRGVQTDISRHGASSAAHAQPQLHRLPVAHAAGDAGAERRAVRGRRRTTASTTFRSTARARATSSVSAPPASRADRRADARSRSKR